MQRMRKLSLLMLLLCISWHFTQRANNPPQTKEVEDENRITDVSLGLAIAENSNKKPEVYFENFLPWQGKRGSHPTTMEGIQKSCSFGGMDCAFEFQFQWTKSNCFKEEDHQNLITSIHERFEPYNAYCGGARSFLFDRQRQQRGNLFRKIEQHWFVCTQKLIETFKEIHYEIILSGCCVRYRYLHCINKLANNEFCSDTATQLQNLANWASVGKEIIKSFDDISDKPETEEETDATMLKK